MSHRRPAERGAARSHARDERLALAEAVILLWIVGVALRVMPFRVLASRVLRDRAARGPAISPERLEDIVARASAWCWPAPGCLARALVLARLLAQSGHDARLVLGVAAREGSFAAHAWVDHAGRALDSAPRAAMRYTELCSLDATPGLRGRTHVREGRG